MVLGFTNFDREMLAGNFGNVVCGYDLRLLRLRQLADPRNDGQKVWVREVGLLRLAIEPFFPPGIHDFFLFYRIFPSELLI